MKRLVFAIEEIEVPHDNLAGKAVEIFRFIGAVALGDIYPVFQNGFFHFAACAFRFLY
jgi:hypothetical protein